MARRGNAPNRQPPDWHFWSFPTFFGFSAGAFIATVIGGVLGLGYPVFVLSMFGVAFCTAHTFTHWLRRRISDKRMTRMEEDERERRVLATRAAAAREATAEGPQRRRRRRRRA